MSELWLGPASVAAVKNAILTGKWGLIPAMARSRSGRLVNAKRRRMQVAVANGLLVLLPSAWVLAGWASAGRFDAAFYTLQGVELLAGAVNWTLLTLNMRDGLRMAGR